MYWIKIQKTVSQLFFVFVLIAVFLPAPIVYGKLFDSLCLAWTHSCTGKGACSLYDVTGMRLSEYSCVIMKQAVTLLYF